MGCSCRCRCQGISATVSGGARPRKNENDGKSQDSWMVGRPNTSGVLCSVSVWSWCIELTERLTQLERRMPGHWPVRVPLGLLWVRFDTSMQRVKLQYGEDVRDTSSLRQIFRSNLGYKGCQTPVKEVGRAGFPSRGFESCLRILPIVVRAMSLGSCGLVALHQGATRASARSDCRPMIMSTSQSLPWKISGWRGS